MGKLPVETDLFSLRLKLLAPPPGLLANGSHCRDSASHKKGGEMPVKKDRIILCIRIALARKASYRGAEKWSDLFEKRCEKCPKSND